jgi:hypothetical protein
MAKMDGRTASRLAQSEQDNVAHVLFTMGGRGRRFVIRAGERIRGDTGVGGILRIEPASN